MIVYVLIADIAASYIEYVRSCEWHERAACRGVDPALFFPEVKSHAETQAAINVCEVCPVQEYCDQYAFMGHETEGIWGGRTVRQRRRARKEWMKIFADAGVAYPVIPRPRSNKARRQDATAGSPERVKPRVPYLVEFLGGLPDGRLDDNSGRIIEILARELKRNINSTRATIHTNRKAGLIHTDSRTRQGTYAIWLTSKGRERVGLGPQNFEPVTAITSNGSKDSAIVTSTHCA